jgi:CRISPR-associated Csx10 family RAMP protein
MDQVVADFRKDDKSEEYHPQYLSGSMFIDEKQLEILETLIEDSLFAGAERTRGLGEIELSVKEIPYPESDIDGWNEQFKKRLQLFTEKDISSNTYFSIKLGSHAILTDRFLRPVSDIEEFSSPEFAQILKIVKPHTVRGWQSAWNMPKADDTGVAMGSVFLFQYKGDDPEHLKTFLKTLGIKGIGLRREEGFGRISVCDNLHIIEEEI